MMNRRSVYIFVFGGLILFGALIVMSAVRQGWFLPSVRYSAVFESGEGILVGTPVSIAGLRAGSVKKVELNQQNKVVVEVAIQSKFADKIREDSKAVVGRPFIIGEKAISITPGNPESSLLLEGSVITGEESLEITDMLSGGRLSPYFNTFTKLMEQIQIVIEGDGSAGAVTLLDVYKQANRSLLSIEHMAKDFRLMRTEFIATDETRKILRDLAASSGQLEGVLVQTQKALPALTQLSEQIVTVVPQLTKTMEETVFTLQAMQHSFVLSGGVKKLREEQEKEKKRSPASRGEADKAPELFH